MDDFVILKTYNTRLDASVDKSYLLSEGVESVVEADDLGGMYPFPFQPSSSGVLLKVHKKDFEKASGLLNKTNLK